MASFLGCRPRTASPIEEARRLADAGKHAEAAAAFDAILAGTPGDAIAVSGWCRSIRRLGRVEEIKSRYANVDRPEARLALGLAAMYAGNADASEAELTRAVTAFEGAGDRMGQATALSAIGIVDFNLRKEPKKAIEPLDRAEKLARAAGDEIATAEILNNLASAHIRDGDTKAAEVELVEADRLASRQGFDGLRAILLTGLGNLHKEAGDWNGAIDAFGRARKVLESRNDPVGLGTACINLALAFQRTGRHREALEAASAAGAAGRAAKDARLEARGLELQGNSLVDLGDVDAARTAFQSALSLLEGVDAPDVVHAVWTGLGNVELAARELDSACGWYEKCLEADVAAEDAEGEAIDRLNLGEAHMEAGRWAAAAAEFDRADALFGSSVDDPGRHARALIGLARIDEAVGNPAPSRDRLTKALELARKAEDRSNEAFVLALLGRRELDDGHAEAALGQFEESRRLYSAVGERPSLARQTLGCADALLALGRFDDARAKAEEISRILHPGENPDLRGLAELSLGKIEAARGDNRLALAHLQSADRLLADAREDAARIDVAILTAKVKELGGDRASALAALVGATRLDQALLDRAGGSDFETGLQALTSSASRALALLQMRMGEPVAALEALESGRARALRRRMAAAGLSEADDAPAREWRHAGAEISRVTASLRKPSVSKTERAALLEKLDQAERDSARALRTREDALGLGTMSFDVSVASFEQRLEPTEALVTFVLDDPHSYAWLVRRSGVEVVELAGAAQVRASAGALLGPLLRGDASDATMAASQLGALVAAPLASKWSGIERLYVVPDDVLWRVPFHALRVGEGSAAKFVAETVETVVLPAAATLPDQRASLARASTHGGMIVAVGDPSFTAPASGSKWQLADASSPTMRGLAEDARTLERLPASGTEARTIAGTYPKGRSVVLIGDDATESAVKAWASRRPAVLHVATHALADEHVLDRSALVLAADRAGTDDGLLTVGEIAGLRVDGSLVVLSACRTAGHRVVTGEGMQGLARAFLSAGAGAVVATLWPVEDRAAAEMMVAFHRGLASGLPAGRALNDARRELLHRRDSDLASPAAWAAFVLFGDGRAGIEKR